MNRVAGRLYDQQRLDALRKYLDRNNVDLVLNSTESKFIAHSMGGHPMYLPPDPTYYEIYHECSTIDTSKASDTQSSLGLAEYYTATPPRPRKGSFSIITSCHESSLSVEGFRDWPSPIGWNSVLPMPK